MRLLTFTVFVACLALAWAQFDHEPFNEGESLNLGSAGDFSEDNVQSVDDFILACDVKIHEVNGLDDFSTLVRGAYTVGLFNLTDDLTFELQGLRANGSFFTLCAFDDDRSPANLGTVSASDCTYECTDANGCVVDFYCDDFEDIEDLQIVVWQDTPVEIVNYTLYFRQWVEDVEVVDIDQDGFYDVDTKDPRFYISPNGDFRTSYPGVRFYHHYYLDLERELTNRGYHSELTITLGNVIDELGFNATDGTIRFCYGVGNIVSDFDSSPGGDCSIDCDSASLTGNDDGSVEIEFVFNGCDVPQDILYLAVQTPDYIVDYTIHVEFTELRNYPIIVVDEVEWESDAFLSGPNDDSCEPEEGQFTCERYYETNLDSIGGSFSKNALGPFLINSIHGINNGRLSVVTNDDKFGGPKSRCDASKQFFCGRYDDSLDGGGSEPNNAAPGPYFNSSVIGTAAYDSTDCVTIIPPCAWNDDLSNNWVTTVFAVEEWNFSDQVFYGIDFSIVYMQETSISPSAGVFLTDIDELERGHYHHYKVSIATNVITPDARLIAELTSRNEDSGVSFFWQWGSHAGLKEHCYDYQGGCSTINNEYYDNNYNEHTYYRTTETSNRCRFSWFVCADGDDSVDSLRRVGQNVYPGDEIISSHRAQRPANNGTAISLLQAGDLYISVHAMVQPPDLGDQIYGDSYYQTAYDDVSEYTIELIWEQEEELKLNDIVFGVVYHEEYTHQYFIDMPTDEDVTGLSISVGDVTNNGFWDFAPDFLVAERVHAYWQCDAFAGECPCYTSAESHFFDDYQNNTQKTFHISRNACPGRVYVSLYREDARAGSDYHFLAASGFTLLAKAEYALAGLPVYEQTGIAQPFIVPRYPTWGTKVAFAPAFSSDGCTACSNYDFYAFQYSGLSETDGLQVRLEVVPSVDNVVLYAYMYVFSESVNLGRRAGTCNRGPFVHSVQLQGCRAIANSEYYYSYYYDQIYSSCTVHLEPCTTIKESYNQADECSESSSFDAFSGTQLVNDRQFYTDKKYYAAIQNVQSNTGFTYNLKATVVGQTVQSLTNAIALRDSVFEHTYNHYSYSVQSSPAASLIVDVWAIYEEFPHFVVYLNSGSLAGSAVDCYDYLRLGCAPCYVRPSNPSCRMQVPACELVPTETYFVSVRSLLNSVYEARSDHMSGFHYNIRATTVSAVELLQNNGHPVTGHLKSFSQEIGRAHV